MPNYTTHTLISNCDQTKLSVTIFGCDNPKGLVVISHGMQENKKRYYPYLQYLNSNGYACIIHDHRGHGQSIATKEELGHFNDITATYIILDLKQVIQYGQSLYPNIKTILLGHSMGSLVARCFVKENSNLLNGLIISGSPSYQSGAKLGIKLCNQLAKKYGWNYKSDLITKMAVGNFNRKFKKENNPNAWMCTNLSTLIDFASDPVNGQPFTLNGYDNLFKLVLNTYDLNGYKDINTDLPILFIAGKDDPCIINETKFKQAQDTMKKAGFNNIEAILYDNMRHEVLNETNNIIVYKDTLNFINSIK